MWGPTRTTPHGGAKVNTEFSKIDDEDSVVGGGELPEHMSERDVESIKRRPTFLDSKGARAWPRSAPQGGKTSKWRHTTSDNFLNGQEKETGHAPRTGRLHMRAGPLRPHLLKKKNLKLILQ